jgi:hypothetical protein
MFHSERAHAIAAYLRFVAENRGKTGASLLAECNPNEPRILGSDDFAGRLLGTAWKPRSHKTLHQLVEEACRSFHVTEADLHSPSTARALTKARAWIAHHATTERIASLSGVARLFGRSEAQPARKRQTPFRDESPLTLGPAP